MRRSLRGESDPLIFVALPALKVVNDTERAGPIRQPSIEVKDM